MASSRSITCAPKIAEPPPILFTCRFDLARQEGGNSFLGRIIGQPIQISFLTATQVTANSGGPAPFLNGRAVVGLKRSTRYGDEIERISNGWIVDCRQRWKLTRWSHGADYVSFVHWLLWFHCIEFRDTGHTPWPNPFEIFTLTGFGRDVSFR